MRVISMQKFKAAILRASSAINARSAAPMLVFTLATSWQAKFDPAYTSLNNDELLRSLGYSDEQIRRMRADGIVSTDRLHPRSDRGQL